jgi:deoxyadenosine/deoxycytidine kinase
MKGVVIGVEGIIGAGKSTFVKKLAGALQLRPIHEPVDAEILDAFYRNPKEKAYDFQLDMLLKRWDVHDLAQAEARVAVDYMGAVVDRTLVGDRCFAKMHYREGNINEQQWKIYERFFTKAVSKFERPAALIYLDADPSVALERVKNRNRGAEANMSPEYLANLRKEYLDLISEIEAKIHPWGAGIQIMREAWNVDHQEVAPIAEKLKDILKLTR